MKFFKWIKGLFKKKKPATQFPKPGPVKLPGIKFGYIVGHTERAKGAVAHNGIYEYDYWKAVVENHLCYETRDQGGVKLAAEKLYKRGCTHIIELHFNNFNGEAQGCEALCHDESEPLANRFSMFMSKKIGNKNRGAKNVRTHHRGRTNVYTMAKFTPNSILIEPFFGDNPKDYVSIDRMRQLLMEFEQYIKEI